MNYYNGIKQELINNEVNRKVKNYSIKLINDVDRKYNITNLKRMRQFYLMIEKGALMGHQLTWSHYRELIPIK